MDWPLQLLLAVVECICPCHFAVQQHRHTNLKKNNKRMLIEVIYHAADCLTNYTPNPGYNQKWTMCLNELGSEQNTHTHKYAHMRTLTTTYQLTCGKALAIEWRSFGSFRIVWDMKATNNWGSRGNGRGALISWWKLLQAIAGMGNMVRIIIIKYMAAYLYTHSLSISHTQTHLKIP